MNVGEENGMDKNSSYPDGTLYQELRNRYLNIDDNEVNSVDNSVESSNEVDDKNKENFKNQVIIYMVKHQTYLD